VYRDRNVPAGKEQLLDSIATTISVVVGERHHARGVLAIVTKMVEQWQTCEASQTKLTKPVRLLPFQ
jgi:hypothetical protein